MSDARRRFDPSELDLGADPEGAELLATARDLESYASSGLRRSDRRLRGSGDGGDRR